MGRGFSGFFFVRYFRSSKVGYTGLEINRQTYKHPTFLTLEYVLGRRRKARTVFSDAQLAGLEQRFSSQRYLSTPGTDMF